MDFLTLIVVILLVLWITGAFVVPVGGSAIHVLIVLVVVILIIRLARGQSV